MVLIEFFKIHYNFAALGVIFLMLAIYLYTLGNIRYAIITTLVLVVYLTGIHVKTQKDPNWVVSFEESVSGWDFVSWVWGGSATTQMKSESEKRLQGP